MHDRVVLLGIECGEQSLMVLKFGLDKLRPVWNR
jgi:hypothetical protein